MSGGGCLHVLAHRDVLPAEDISFLPNFPGITCDSVSEIYERALWSVFARPPGTGG